MENIMDYLTPVLEALLVGVAGYLATVFKGLATKYLNDKTKKDVAKTVVQAVEQLYKDLNGEEKLSMAIENASEMLTEKGITCSDIELRLLLESAVGEFNNVFNKGADVNE